MIKLRYFTDEEFQRVSSSPMILDEDAIIKLDMARHYAGVPFKLNSAYRSPADNASVGGVERSAHLSGTAFDIACNNSYQRERIVAGALAAGFNRIGIGKTFVHLDCDPSLPAHRIWLYS